MADISAWSPVDESNTAAPPHGWPENMQPSGVNNSARALMGGVRRWYDTVTAQIADIYGRLSGYLPLTGGTITGNLGVSGFVNAARYDLSSTPFAQRNGNAHEIYDADGQLALALYGAAGAQSNYYRADTHGFQNNAGSSIATISSAGTLTVGLDANVGRNVGVTGTLFAASVDCSGRVNGAYYDCDGVKVIDTSGGSTFLYRQAGVPAIQLQNFNTYYDNAGHIFRNQGATTIFTIDASGNANATAQLQGASVYSRGNIDAVGNIAASGTLYAAGTITAVGAVNSPKFQGGPSNAAQLGMYGTTDAINFRWYATGTGQVAYRVNETIEKYIATTANVLDTQYAGGAGGPTGVVFGGHDFPGTWYYAFVDSTSDERIKSNIAPSEIDALSIIKQVPVDQYDIRPEVARLFRTLPGMHGREEAASDHVAIGLVAQKLQALIPEAVYVGPQPGDNDLPEDCRNIALPAITPYLIRAVQQLAARLEELEGAR